MADVAVLPMLFRCMRCTGVFPLSSFRLVDRVQPVTFAEVCVECEAKSGADPKLRAANDVGAHIIDANVNEQQRIAKKEFARRELMKRHLVYYVQQMYPEYKPGWVHYDICRRLERFMLAVERGESPRLILNMPPRHGKSTLASNYFISWLLGHHPNWGVISTSYAVTLPLDFSREIRERLQNPFHKELFPKCSLRDDAQGVEKWKTTKNGGYRAAGVGTGITGMGAHVLVVDDPYADSEQAESETVRNKVMSWFNTTAYSRLAPGGGVLIIHTRWHDADLTGQLLIDMREKIGDGSNTDEIDMWELVTYPAIAEEDEYLDKLSNEIVRSPIDTHDNMRLLRKTGEALHPIRYDTPALLRIKSRYTKSEWSSLYQQNPIPDDGDYFSKDDVRYGEMSGTNEEYVFFSAWDMAIGQKTRNDWTVGVVGAMDWRGDIYIVDMVRARIGTFDIIESICTFVQKWGLAVLGIENGHISQTLMPMLLEELRKRRLTVTFDEDLKPMTDKVMRARPLQGMMRRGQIFFPPKQPWSDQAVEELLRFPVGQFDDRVDALAWLARMAQRIAPPQMGRSVRKQPSSWKNELSSFIDEPTKSFMAA